MRKCFLVILLFSTPTCTRCLRAYWWYPLLLLFLYFTFLSYQLSLRAINCWKQPNHATAQNWRSISHQTSLTSSTPLLWKVQWYAVLVNCSRSFKLIVTTFFGHFNYLNLQLQHWFFLQLRFLHGQPKLKFKCVHSWINYVPLFLSKFIFNLDIPN